jgi:hypothetical protein
MALLWLAVPCTILPAHAGEFSDNPDVALEATFLRDSAQCGDTVELLLTFRPGENIHLTTTPPVKFIPDSSNSAAPAGVPEGSADPITGFLSTAAPVLLPLKLGRSLPPGKRLIRGIVSYYYCSESDGWCRNFRQPVELPLFVID